MFDANGNFQDKLFGLPRSRTVQPSANTSFENPSDLLPPSSGPRRPRSPEMASAPDVNASRRNFADKQEYVKSWSLDVARYQSQPSCAVDPFVQSAAQRAGKQVRSEVADCKYRMFITFLIMNFEE